MEFLSFGGGKDVSTHYSYKMCKAWVGGELDDF